MRLPALDDLDLDALAALLDPLDEAVDEHDAEAGLLLDPAVRLDSADTYGAGVGGFAR